MRSLTLAVLALVLAAGIATANPTGGGNPIDGGSGSGNPGDGAVGNPTDGGPGGKRK